MMTFKKLLLESTISTVEDISKDDIVLSEMGLDVFKTRLNDINKKATRWGLPEVKFEIIREENKEIPNEIDPSIKQYKKIFTIKVIGKSPQIEGYEFIAKIEHTDSGNLINIAPDSSIKDLPVEYRSADSKCDICKSKRERFNTFIIRDVKNNTLLTVGSTCLKRFLPIDSVNKLINYAEMLERLRNIGDGIESEEGDGEKGFGGQRNYFGMYNLIFSLALAYLVKGKYISAKKSKEIADTTGDYVESTADLAKYIMFYRQPPGEPRPKEIVRADELKSEADTLTKEVMSWMKTHDFKADAERKPEMANYFNNLDVLSKSSVVKLKNIGYLGGLLVSYIIEKELIKKKEAQASKKPSEFVGKVGEKISFVGTLLFQRTFDTQYGVTTLYSFEDTEGNRFTWFSSNDLGITDKTQYKIVKATVKAHQVSKYGGHNETVVTRVKLEDMQGNKINEELFENNIKYSDFYE